MLKYSFNNKRTYSLISINEECIKAMEILLHIKNCCWKYRKGSKSQKKAYYLRTWYIGWLLQIIKSEYNNNHTKMVLWSLSFVFNISMTFKYKNKHYDDLQINTTRIKTYEYSVKKKGNYHFTTKVLLTWYVSTKVCRKVHFTTKVLHRYQFTTILLIKS